MIYRAFLWRELIANSGGVVREKTRKQAICGAPVAQTLQEIPFGP